VRDNPSSAGNQQERPISPEWIVGFVDGEGCFSISLVRQSGGLSRKGYKTGWQVAPRFAVAQGARSAAVLHDLKSFFGVGCVYRNRRHDNHKEDLYRYDVSNRFELAEVIVPFFQRNPLRTDKRRDFEQFTRCLELIIAGRHIEREGLVQVLLLMETMNHRKSRHDLIGILRDHTPEIRDTGS
jgi:hypothetical protein